MFLTRNRLGYILIAPSVALVCSILLYPLIKTIIFSFSRIKGLEVSFYGFGNYLKIFTDPEFYQAFGRTLYYTGLSVCIQLVLGLLIAILVNRKGKFLDLVRTFLLIPWATAFAIAGILWKYMLNPVFGIITLISNNVLLSLHIIKEPVNWVMNFPMETVILIDIWLSTPFVILFCLAGLQAIPQEILEAAKIDGANSFHRLRSIILPLLKPTLLVVLLFRTIGALRIFDIPWALSGGEVTSNLEVTSIHAYRYMFSYLQFDRGSAETVILIAISITLCYFFIKIILKDLES